MSDVMTQLSQTNLLRTPDQVLGPFYPIVQKAEAGGDLTRISGRPGRAHGLVLNLMGRVLTSAGIPVRGARIEIWQANAHGRYRHPNDTSTTPLDPNFEGFAVLTTDHEGRYSLKTIKPAAYSVAPGRVRPAHIHFEVLGHTEKLTTQMYFPDDPHNATDLLRNSTTRPDALNARILDGTSDVEAGSKIVLFDIILAGG